MKVLEEVVNPKLNKLREQKRAYLEFQKLSKELEELTQFLVAHEYYKNQVSSGQD
jgi:structural maintenance of chromosome 2